MKKLGLQYQLVYFADLDLLARAVGDLLAEGWSLHGQPVVHGARLVQAMTKPGAFKVDVPNPALADKPL